MFSVYAGRGYARHLHYLKPIERSDAIKFNTVSRSLCLFAIASGKISVAFLIERIAGSSNWRKWMLRSMSISIFLTAVIISTLFWAQCQPVRAVWDKSMLVKGTGKCWDPTPINRYLRFPRSAHDVRRCRLCCLAVSTAEIRLTHKPADSILSSGVRKHAHFGWIIYESVLMIPWLTSNALQATEHS